MFKSVLIANRGEIAVRVLRACRALGIRGIAVYSDADAAGLHVRLADKAVCIGPAPARESYLNARAILAAARKHHAEAVHPGYGLLAENAAFAQAVVDHGVAFIGPAPETIAEMGDKVAARAAAERAEVPVLPGTQALHDAEQATDAGADIGYPLLVKSSFGGGGRGMRVVRQPNELADAVRDAGKEAAAAFGRAELFLERYLPRPRHVEVQLLADAHGTVVHLGDRDCSVQRRHQKLVEEAPAPGLPEELRSRLTQAAVRLARETRYVGVGTIEFLVDPATAEFYFLEMNTRLQVEHGVTELTSGIDLVQEQILVASGEPLDVDQDAVRPCGHAIQARLVAEDPYAGFRPAPGTVHDLHLPTGPWLRLDFGIDAGDRVPAEYDSLFGKLLAWGPNRDTARRRLATALDELRVSGIPHTGDYLRTILERPDFLAARHDTGSVERDWQPDPAAQPLPTDVRTKPVRAPDPVSTREVSLHTDHGPVHVLVYGCGDHDPVTPPAPSPVGPRGTPYTESAESTGESRAPMDASVAKVLVTEGAQVAARDVLVVLEAMKMEIEITASHPGTVRQVLVSSGESVSAGAVLVTLDG